MAPTHLHHADLWICEVMYGSLKNIGGWDEIGVEDQYELAFTPLEAGGEGTGFKAVTVGAPDIFDIQSVGGQALDDLAGLVAGLVLRVVEDLDFKAVARIVEVGYGIEQALDDVVFVVERQLHCDDGQVAERRGLRGGVWVVSVKKAQKLIAVEAVYAEKADYAAISDKTENLPEFHTSGELSFGLVLR